MTTISKAMDAAEFRATREAMRQERLGLKVISWELHKLLNSAAYDRMPLYAIDHVRVAVNTADARIDVIEKVIKAEGDR